MSQALPFLLLAFVVIRAAAAAVVIRVAVTPLLNTEITLEGPPR